MVSGISSQLWSKSGQIRQSSGQVWSVTGRLSASFAGGRFGRLSVHVWSQSGARFSRIRANFGRCRAKFGQCYARCRPRKWPSSDQQWSIPGRIWSNAAHSLTWPSNFVRLWAKLADVGRRSPQLGPTLARSRPVGTRLSPSRPGFGQSWKISTDVGRICAKLRHACQDFEQPSLRHATCELWRAHEIWPNPAEAWIRRGLRVGCVHGVCPGRSLRSIKRSRLACPESGVRVVWDFGRKGALKARTLARIGAPGV